MPVPTETLRNTRTIGLVFGVSSVALLVSLVWMIKVDYARPWRAFQDDLADLQVSLAYFDVLALETRDSLEELAQAQGAVAGAKRKLEAQQQQVRQIWTALAGADASQWAEAAEATAKELVGPFRAACEAQARAIGEAFAGVIAEQAADLDAPILAERVQGNAKFRQQLVRLVQWFDLQKLQEQTDAIRGDYARADLEFKGVKGDLTVAVAAYEHEKGLHGADDHRTQIAQEALKETRERYDRAKLRVETLADQRDAVEDQQKLLRSEVTTAERTLAQIEKVRNDARKRYADYSDTVRRGIFNMPLVDFATPKGTRGRHEIRQAVLPDVRMELNFVKGYQTDRCMTCHAAIDDKNFTKENLAKKLEQAIFSINEQLEREGRAERLTPPGLPGETETGEDDGDSGSLAEAGPGAIARAWHRLTPQEQDELFEALCDEVNKYQRMRGEPELNFGQPLLAHPNMDLFVAPDSPHPVSRMGCTVCHEGNGEETDFVLAAHTPKSEQEREKWKEKYYVRTAGLVPEQNFETAEHHWNRPMLQPKYSEAGCTKCHSRVADIAMYNGKPAATRINEGRFLFTSLGCINCHLVEDLAGYRKVGPDLSHVGEKITRSFAENWIFFPADYRPSTHMPHFFLQENNDARSETAGGDADPVLRTKTEVVAMAEYLFAVSTPYEKERPPEDLWAPLKDPESEEAIAAADRGRRRFGSVGCLACHPNLAYQPNDESNQPLPPLAELWIVPDIEKKIQDLAHSTQLAKARRLKAIAVKEAVAAGEDPDEVVLDEAAEARIAVEVEDGGEGIALSILLDAFKNALGSNGYDVYAARKAAFKAAFEGMPGLTREDVFGVTLTDEEYELAELSDEAYEAITDFAYACFDEMTYVDRVQYAMRHFDDASDTLFDPGRIGERPVFTRFAPELSSIGTKFADYEQAVEWLYDWLKNPRHYSSYTKMPSLRLGRGEFPVIDLETGEATGEQVVADEALDIAVYLATLNENEEFAEKAARRLPEQEGEDPAAYAAKRDELLGILLGGLNSRARTESILNDEGGQLSERLVTRLSRSLGEQEARNRIASMDLDQKRWMFLGDKMIGHYGCYACHQISGYETAPRPGTELTTWGEKQLSQLDFAFFEPAFREQREHDPLFRHLYPVDPNNPADRAKLIEHAWTNPEEQVEHTLASFAWHKLRNPRIWDRRKLKGPYDKLKMPNFFLTDEQADALVTFLLSRKPANVNQTLQVDYEGMPAGRIANGRNLVRELNCVGCHQIDGNAAVMHQYITRSGIEGPEYDEVNGPPWLHGQGAKVQPDWFYGFLNNVEMLRPWLKVRMPSFHLDNAQATTLVEYFVGLSQAESQWLARHLAPVQKYIADERALAGDTILAARDRAPGAAGNEPAGSAADSEQESPLPPGSDWFEKEGLLAVAAILRDYAVDNRLVTSAAVDPESSSPEELAQAHADIVRHAEFLRRLYDVTYPFTESGTQASASLAADGEVLFYELKCLACHVFGDSKAPGANPMPTAPNLQLAHERLQSAWVHKWLETPNRIQPGTKMPSLFGMSGDVSAFGDYPPEYREQLLAKLQNKGVIDDPVLQRAALAAFLYDAGRKRLDKVQPPSGGEEPAGTATEEADRPAESEPEGASAETGPASMADENAEDGQEPPAGE